MQMGFMMQKAVGQLFILKSTKPLPIIFKRHEKITFRRTAYIIILHNEITVNKTFIFHFISQNKRGHGYK